MNAIARCVCERWRKHETARRVRREVTSKNPKRKSGDGERTPWRR
jgi:hypothetical protein